jgi:hypothetical protein
MLSNAADLSSKKMCPLCFGRFVSFRKTDRGSGKSKVEMPGRTKVLAPVRIKYLVIRFTIRTK